MAVHAAVLRNSKKARSGQCLVTSSMVLSLGLVTARSRMRQSVERLNMQEVVFLQIGVCSAEVHKDLADVNLKLKFVVDGNTHLKSKAGKASIGMDEDLRISFDNMGEGTIYEGGDMLQFELCRAGVFRSSQTLAICAVPAMTVLKNIFNAPGKEMNLELIALDTPGKVLANLTVQIGFRIANLKDLGGFRMLKTPSLRIPAYPTVESERTTTESTLKRDSETIASFCRKVDEVADRLKAAHVASIHTIAACTQNDLRSFQLQVAAAGSIMASAPRPRESPRSSEFEMAEADGVSTATGDGADEESLFGGDSTFEVTSIQSSQSTRVSLQSHVPQSNQFDEIADGVLTSPTSLSPECPTSLHASVGIVSI